LITAANLEHSRTADALIVRLGEVQVVSDQNAANVANKRSVPAMAAASSAEPARGNGHAVRVAPDAAPKFPAAKRRSGRKAT
jgi:hypothetical protein